jgi:hypothetical protein
MYGKLFEELIKAEIELLVWGGAAVSLHGFTRMTEDIDILLRNSHENIESFVMVMGKWGQGCGSDLTFADFQGPGCVRIEEDFPLDVFTLIGGKPFEQFVVHAVGMTLANGVTIRCLSIADLIELKKGTLREKDLLDVNELGRRMRESPPQTTPPTINLVPREPEGDNPPSA